METAENGQQAVNLFKMKGLKYDAVLMDMFMPLMNGVKATKEIRMFEKEKNRQKTPIIIVTGNFTKFDRMKAQNLACDDFLCKPLDKDMLVQSLQRIFNKSNIDKVLIIEDDETQAFILKQMLTQLQISNIEIR